MNWQMTWTAASRVTGWYAVERWLEGQRAENDWNDIIRAAADEITRPAGPQELPVSWVAELLRECLREWSDDARAGAIEAGELETQVGCIVQRRSGEVSAGDLSAPELGADEVREVAARLARVARTFDARLPRLAHELPLRAGPLREQWEARGPGLMRRIQRLWSEDWHVASASVALVHPVYGGGGVPLSGSVVAFEAMLYNRVPALPEILRLGWLLAQLPGLIGGSREGTMCDSLLANEAFKPGQRLALALLPVVLEAGEYVELTRNDAATLQVALVTWCGCGTADAERLGPALDAWWRNRQAPDTK